MNRKPRKKHYRTTAPYIIQLNVIATEVLVHRQQGHPGFAGEKVKQWHDTFNKLKKREQKKVKNYAQKVAA